MAKTISKGSELVMVKNHEGKQATSSFPFSISFLLSVFMGISLVIAKEYTTYYDIGCHR